MAAPNWAPLLNPIFIVPPTEHTAPLDDLRELAACVAEFAGRPGNSTQLGRLLRDIGAAVALYTDAQRSTMSQMYQGYATTALYAHLNPLTPAPSSK